jgi:hypothetical protein
MVYLITVELVTAIIFVALALIAGYRGSKLRGAISFGLFATVISTLFIAGTLQLESYFWEDVIVWLGSLAETAFILIGVAMLLGYMGEKGMGAVLFGIGAIAASILCLVGTLLGYYWGGGNGGAWFGLLLSILLVRIMVVPLLGKFIKGHSRRFLAGLWFGFCALCIMGYLAGSWVGFLTITLPAIALFWFRLYRASGYILPLRDKTNRGQRHQAFRSLITFTMGTNYPYYFVDENSRPVERVQGNPYLQFFAGPGIVYSNCEHAAYITNGVSRNRVFEPGLSFTDIFDLSPRVIDLRPQLPAFPVEALTKDGIPIRVLTFTPFRIDTGGQQVELGQSFPFRHQAVYNVVATELVERTSRKEESGEKHRWDGRLVPVIATRIVQDIISRYTLDELCAPLDTDLDPRDKIVKEMRKRLREALSPYGLELVGGGISNLMPQAPAIIERRLESWRIEWVRKIKVLMGEGEAERVRQMELARAQAEVEIVLSLSQFVEKSMRSGDVSHTALALRFIDSLGKFVGEAGTYGVISQDIEKSLKRLRSEIEARES